MSTFLILIFTLFPIASLSEITVHETFASWAATYHTNFNISNTHYFENFENNLNFINFNNLNNLDFEMGLNEFSHLDPDEFVSTHCGAIAPRFIEHLTDGDGDGKSRKLNNYTKETLPESFTWENYKTDVRDQGSECGSCWAFATMGLLGEICGNFIEIEVKNYLIEIIFDGNFCIFPHSVCLFPLISIFFVLYWSENFRPLKKLLKFSKKKLKLLNIFFLN